MGYYELSKVRHVSGITYGGSLRWDDAIDDLNGIQLLDPAWHQLDPAPRGGDQT
jgi:hypothetical protein